jgi:hypothetical protein
MVTLYTILAIVGTGLALLAAFAGHGDHDSSVEAGHDFDQADDLAHPGDAHHEMEAKDVTFYSWLPFFSLRFWTFFAASFGLIGLGLTHLSGMKEPLVGLLSVTIGFAVGLGVSLLFRAAMNVVQSNSSATEQDLMGKEVEVLVAVRPGAPGRIRAVVKGEILDVIAELEGNLPIEAGERAVVVGYERDRARVMACNLALEQTVEQKG